MVQFSKVRALAMVIDLGIWLNYLFSCMVRNIWLYGQKYLVVWSEIFGHPVFMYLVVQFRSNVPIPTACVKLNHIVRILKGRFSDPHYRGQSVLEKCFL